MENKVIKLETYGDAAARQVAEGQWELYLDGTHFGTVYARADADADLPFYINLREKDEWESSLLETIAAALRALEEMVRAKAATAGTNS